VCVVCARAPRICQAHDFYERLPICVASSPPRGRMHGLLKLVREEPGCGALFSPRFPFSIQQDVHRIDVTACAPCLYTPTSSLLRSTKQSFVWCSFSSLNTTNYETNRTHNCNLQG
jgi:hypothetical protein